MTFTDVTQEEETVEQSSGNVFADLGLRQPEEALAKAQLAAAIAERIRRQKLTQKQAAEQMGIDQPKVSALMNGRLSGFSIDRLLRFLVALGYGVEIAVGARGEKHPTVRVRESV